MSLFAPTTAPRVFALEPGVDFAAALVDGLAARLGDAPPEAWAAITIWVNTRRTARRLETLLVARGPGLMPQLRVLSDLAHWPDPTLPAAPDPLQRQLALATLVAAYQAQRGLDLPSATVLDLAQSLGDLLDELEGEGLRPSALGALDATSLPRHWADNLQFLGILEGYLAALGRPYSGGEGRRARIVAQIAKDWQTSPPQGPVLVAGSTGSRRVTRDFMAAVAALPQGAVILPGADPATVDAPLGADHPQAALAATRAALGLAEGDILPWHNTAPPVPARNALVSLALRPAPVTDEWLTKGPALLPSLPTATQGLSLIEADSQRHEAQSIALALRRALALGQSAALVTPDRVLARRVGDELRRFNITPDDSAGQPLHLTPPGLFLRILASLEGDMTDPVTLLELLRHPLVGGAGAARGAHLAHVQALELGLLRGGPPMLGAAALRTWAAPDEGRAAWLDPLLAALFPTLPAGAQGLSDWATSLKSRAESLCPPGDDSPLPRIWEKEAGEAAFALLDQLAAAGEGAPPQPPRLWSALLLRQMQGREVRPPAFLPHPGIAIWGPLEARVQSADLLILGGLTEGSWPARLSEDHWLNRPMRRDIGLPLPETRVGLAAHDFQSALGAGQVILSRALRDGDAETLPSRWLLRVVNLLQGLGDAGQSALAEMRARGAELTALARRLDRPTAPIPPAPRPCPAPPLALRPDRLSVTQVETLVQDPYATYARHILRLKKLDPLGRVADALERGTVLHEVLAALMHSLPSPVPTELSPDQIARMDAILDARVPWPAARLQWRSFILSAMGWLLQGEATRRAFGTPHGSGEVAGALTLDIAARPFTLIAKADRVDRSPDGRLALYDYKSGSTPSQSAAGATAIQLALERIIAEAGGFTDIPAGPVAVMEYLLLGSLKSIAAKNGAYLTTDIRLDLEAFLAAYADPSRGYLARARHDLQAYDGDYDHLSRFGEWELSAPAAPEALS